MRNIALKLMYVGTAYHGWQVQKNAVTVAETLEHSHNQLPSPTGMGSGYTCIALHALVFQVVFFTSFSRRCKLIITLR